MEKIALHLAADLKHYRDKTPYAYILFFADGSVYVGSASGIYRMRYFRSVARGTYPSLKKNPLLINALKTLDCCVMIRWCSTLADARELEKESYKDMVANGVELRNSREFGWAGKWVRQDPQTRERRMQTLRENGRLTMQKLHANKLPDGRSEISIKSTLMRVQRLGQTPRKLAELSEETRLRILNGNGHCNAI